jgi:nucleotide-binding universal stress UspA family protein
VIGSHGLTGLAHVLFGSTADRIVRRAKCSVLTVRPRGEKS